MSGHALGMGDTYEQPPSLMVDEASRLVTWHGVCIDLTALEFDAVALFVAHAGVILPAETIIRRLWGNELDASPNALQAVISKVRRKLAEHGTDVSIRSIRGLGYVLRSSSPSS